MNLAFIIQNYNYQGGGQVTSILAERFESLGHSVNIIAIKCDKGDLESRPSRFSKITDINASGFFEGIIKLRKIFKNSNTDIFISMGGYSNLSAGLAKFFSRSSNKIIGSEHFAKSVFIGDYAKPIFRLLKPIFQFAYTQLNGLVFVSENLRQEFLKQNSWHSSRCVTINNPVPLFNLNQKNSTFKKDKDITFLGVGILEHRKRFDLLLKSFARVAKPNYKLLIAGTGSLLHDLEDLSKELNIDKQVNFLGYVNDIKSLMEKSDILILTSNSEAFGMVLAEGLSSGIQIVSTNCFSGPSEILGNGRYGYLAEIDNVDSIVSSIKAVIKKPISSEIIKEGALRFSSEFIVEKYLEFILKVKKVEGSLYDTI